MTGSNNANLDGSRHQLLGGALINLTAICLMWISYSKVHKCLGYAVAISEPQFTLNL